MWSHVSREVSFFDIWPAYDAQMTGGAGRLSDEHHGHGREGREERGGQRPRAARVGLAIAACVGGKKDAACPPVSRPV